MQASKPQVMRLLKTAKGQIEGIMNMVEEDRYCIDVYHQILAVQSILKKANKQIMQAHMNACVKDAFENGTEEKKIEEILDILDKLTK
ncbi:MAG: metal-sensing transcriptional repressor [Anaerofustis sp.]